MNLAQIDFAAASRSKCASCHAGHEDHGPGMHPRAAPADAAGGVRGHHRERGDEVGGEVLVVEARHVQLAGRDHGGGAAVHVVADPADGVLRGRPLAKHRMDMAVHQPRHHRAAAGVDRRIGLGIGGRIERGDFRAIDQKRFYVGLRLGDVAGKELADVPDEKRGHRPLPVIPGRAEGANPESSFTFRRHLVPDSPPALAASRSRARNDEVQCLCTADDFSNAAFCSGEASFWCFAFH